MKKIYSGLGILICMSFLFALNSCTTETLIESEDTLSKEDAKNEFHYQNSKKADTLPANIENSHVSAGQIENEFFEIQNEPYINPESISTYSAQTEVNMVVDPDWKNLVTHFIEVNGDTE